MSDRVKLAFLTLALSCFCLAQAQPPAFEVASVKLSSPLASGGGCKGGPGTTDPGIFTCTNQTLQDLIITAFHVNFYQIFSADNQTKYEISAKVPAGTIRPEFDLMMQQLLIERFKLAYHFEKKEMQVYNLIVAKNGLKMHESPPLDPAPATGDKQPPEAKPHRPIEFDADGFPKVAPPPRQSFSMAAQDGLFRWTCKDTGIPMIAGMVGAHLEGPVTDLTGLKGTYDFSLSWSVVDSGPTLAQALQDQLGLTLVRSKGPVDIFVIDHVEKTPIEN